MTKCIRPMGNEEQASPVRQGCLPTWPSLHWWQLKRQPHL